VEGGVTAPIPGKRKLAGETLYDPLSPPQPTVAHMARAVIATRSIFQFNFTMAVCGGEYMRATFNYPGFAAILAAFLGVFGVFAVDTPNFTAEAEKAYREAHAAYETNQNSAEAAILVATRAFDYADLAPNNTIRENVANIGIAIARSVIAKDTNSVAAHYYLSLNIGQLARTKMLSALKLLDDMEHELKTVIKLDRKFDYAGGDRTIGVLYAEAPGFSVGDKGKARTHLSKAVELAPEFPDNHLCYMEALAKWGEWKTLTEKLADYRAIVPKAKEKFTGPEWAYEWHDWTRREKVIAGKLQKR
jgi:tetratricopeptide (TPR) repeat protein